MPRPPATLLVENGPGAQPAAFTAPLGLIRADTPTEVPDALQAIDAALGDGHWVAGLASYELGYAFEPRLAPLMPPDRNVPLLCVGVFDAPEPATRLLARAEGLTGMARLSALRPDWDGPTHAEAARRVIDYIAAGDIYQANLTFPVTADWSGDPWGLYAALRRRQPVPHGAFLSFPDMPPIASRSPELFFQTDAAARIETRPMKGTAPRAPTPEADEALKNDLRFSVKNRAENLMIVDLLRNDISRLCLPGTVRVPALFSVETYETLHQMVSRVTGQLRPGTGFADIMAALFPCGSVTGAPKIRAMEVIRELEPWPRGAYCGTIGWMAPDGSSAFNVAIRTLTLWPDGRADLPVGGGIVADSTPDGEYEEALWKARFARTGPV
jgi:para-aminobenzoate synthetase component 1